MQVAAPGGLAFVILLRLPTSVAAAYILCLRALTDVWGLGILLHLVNEASRRSFIRLNDLAWSGRIDRVSYQRMSMCDHCVIMNLSFIERKADSFEI